jgi:hypothetical protein
MKRGRKPLTRVPLTMTHVCQHLQRDGIKFEASATHDYITIRTHTETIDFWPMRGTWWIREQRRGMTGIVRLIKYVRSKQGPAIPAIARPTT